MEEMMPLDSDISVQDGFTDDCELRQDEFDAISGGKPAKSQHTRPDYFVVELKQVFIASY
jgi:hypothetical protein